MLLNNLNTHDQVEYSINFVKEKMSRIDFVYNMLQDKFVAFWNYIANALKKNWICFFSESTETSILYVKKFNDSLRFCVDYQRFNKIIIKNKYLLFFFLKCWNDSQKRADLSKLIYTMRIIAFEFAKIMNEKLHFAFNMINSNIKSYFLILSMFLLFFNRMLIAHSNHI